MKNTPCLKYQHKKHTLTKNWHFAHSGRITYSSKEGYKSYTGYIVCKAKCNKSQKTAIIPNDLER